MFPPNGSLTVNRADYLVRFIRKNGRNGAVQYAWQVGETADFMDDFTLRNYETIYPNRQPPRKAA